MDRRNWIRRGGWLAAGVAGLVVGGTLLPSPGKKTERSTKPGARGTANYSVSVDLRDALKQAARKRADLKRSASRRAGQETATHAQAVPATAGQRKRGSASLPSGGRRQWKQIPEFHRRGFEQLKAQANAGRNGLRAMQTLFMAQRDRAATKAINDRNKRPKAKKYEGLGYRDEFPESWQPPDPVCAAGPNHVLEAVNDDFTVLDKRGRVVLDDGAGNHSLDFNSFFGTIPGSEEVDWFDPRCLYDESSGRFFLAVAGLDLLEFDESWFAVAVSNTSDPTGTWTIHGTRTDRDGNTPSGDFGDFPDIGIRGDFFVASFNQFDLVTNEFQYAKVRVFSKAALLNPGSVSYVDFINLQEEDGSLADTLRTCKHRGANDAFYMVSCKFDSGNTASIWRLTGTPANPSLSSTMVGGLAPYGIPPAARQPGAPTSLSFNAIDTSDARLFCAVAEDNQIVTAHNTAYLWPKSSELECAIHWFQLNAEAGFEAVVQQGIYGGKGFDYYYPALDTSAGKSPGIAMVFSRSGPRENPGVRTTSRNARLAAGQLRPSKLLRAGNGPFTPEDDFLRWGDYSGADRDPANPAQVFLVGEYSNTRLANNPNAWGTQLGVVKP